MAYHGKKAATAAHTTVPHPNGAMLSVLPPRSSRRVAKAWSRKPASAKSVSRSYMMHSFIA